MTIYLVVCVYVYGCVHVSKLSMRMYVYVNMGVCMRVCDSVCVRVCNCV